MCYYKVFSELERISTFSLIYSTHFLDRELVNIYLAHHVEYGDDVDKINFLDADHLVDYEYTWDKKRKHTKISQIEDIFKSRDATGYWIFCSFHP